VVFVVILYLLLAFELGDIWYIFTWYHTLSSLTREPVTLLGRGLTVLAD